MTNTMSRWTRCCLLSAILMCASGMSAAEDWAIHGQFTYVEQNTDGFSAPYSGPNSLSPSKGKETRYHKIGHEAVAIGTSFSDPIPHSRVPVRAETVVGIFIFVFDVNYRITFQWACSVRRP